MHFRLILLFVLLLGTAINAIAGPFERSITIVGLHPLGSDNHSVAARNFTRVYVNEQAWGSSACRPDAADLKKEDTHLMSILLIAWTTGKNVRIRVDDTLQPIDNVCQITALFVD